MTNLRYIPSESRGHADHGWLDARHSFSFASYHNPDAMGFHSLRVINDDRIAPKTGFPAHPHRNMEILTWVVSGELSHADSAGNAEKITHGTMQRISAGKGIHHSEENAHPTEWVHLYQIWLYPFSSGGEPKYDQITFDADGRKNHWQKLASPEDNFTEGTLSIRQNAELYVTELESGKTLDYAAKDGHALWVQVVEGSASINGLAVNQGDAVTLEVPENIQIEAKTDSQFLLFDLVA